MKSFGLAALLLIIVSPSLAQEPANHTHEGAVGKFYQSWMVPDNRNVSCCHEKDCAPAETKLDHGQWYARKQGDEGNFTLIPDSKVERERDNPDGRNHVCGRRTSTEFTLYCFIFGSGT